MVGILALIAAQAFAAPAWPVRPPTITQAPKPTREWTITWEGAEATLEVRTASGSWTVLETGIRPPYLYSGPTRELRVRHGSQLEEVEWMEGLWTPLDIAAWSGTGIRGHQISGLLMHNNTLWIATQSGGLSAWTGTTYLHADTRTGLPSNALRDLTIHEGDRWLLFDDAVSQLRPDGSLSTFGAAHGLPGGLRHLRFQDETLWLAADTGLYRLRSGAVDNVLSEPCFSFVDLGQTPHILCDSGPKSLPSLAPYPIPDPDLKPRAALPRRDGAWWMSPEGLFEQVGEDLFVMWRSLEGQPQSLGLVGENLLMMWGQEGIYRVSAAPDRKAGGPITVTAVTEADGVPNPAGFSSIPASHPQKAWIGTGEGVAIVTEDGQAIHLQTVSLPSGAQVHDVAAGGSGVALASDDGLTWLGGSAPKGWPSLVAAAKGPVVAVITDSQKGWWAITGSTAFQLDRQGILHRWELGAPGLGAELFNDELALSTAEGIRWWSPGNDQLSSVDHHSPALALEAGAQTGLWSLHESELRLRVPFFEQAWPLPGPSTQLALTKRAAYIVVDGQLLQMAPAQEEFTEIPIDGVVAISANEETLFWLTYDGELYRRQDRKTERFLGASLPTEVHRIIPTPLGLWLLTPYGPYLVSAPKSAWTEISED